MKKIILFAFGITTVPAIVILFVYSAVAPISCWTYVSTSILVALLIAVFKINDANLSKGIYLGVLLLLVLSISSMVIHGGVREFLKNFKSHVTG